MQERSGQPDSMEALPEYAYNVHVAYDAWWHWLKDFDPNATSISITDAYRVVTRYRALS